MADPMRFPSTGVRALRGPVTSPATSRAEHQVHVDEHDIPESSHGHANNRPNYMDEAAADSSPRSYASSGLTGWASWLRKPIMRVSDPPSLQPTPSTSVLLLPYA